MIRFLSGVMIKVAFLAMLSTAASGHEVRPAVGDVNVTASEVTLELRVVLEPLVAGINLAEIADTDEAPQAAEYDRLRALPATELDAAFRAIWPELAGKFTMRAGETVLSPEIADLQIPEVGDIELPRDSTLTLRAILPDDGSAVVIGWDTTLGGLALRQVSETEAYSAYLTAGALSDPLPRIGVAAQTTMEVITNYVISGFEHIIPLGIDHILFVLGLFFFSLAWRPLLWQVSAFTLAHTITLALATLGWVRISGSIVEPLIAASIAYVAIENIFHKGDRSIGWLRIAVVFAFGLLHGLGFASVLGDFGLNEGQFLVSLIAFNVGVELGQLTVIAVAFLTVGLWFGKKPWYRTFIAIPASVAIAIVGAYWAYERVFL